jgi:hypothetical protein
MALWANTAAVPSEAQWLALVSAAKAKPTASAVLAAANGLGAEKYITAQKRSAGAGFVRRYTLAGFEVDDACIDSITTVVNAQAAVYGIVEPTLPARFVAVMEAELQEAATDLGYGAQAANLTIPWYAFGDRGVAIDAAQAYLAAQAAIWYE